MIQTVLFHYWRYNQPMGKASLQKKWASPKVKLGDRVEEFSLNKVFLYQSVKQNHLQESWISWLIFPEAGNEPSFHWLSPQVGTLQLNERLGNGTKSNVTKPNSVSHDIRYEFLISFWKMLQGVILFTALQALKIMLSQYSQPLSCLQYSATS